ncbi:MAG: hypothetical protein NVSMB52_11980 [Chloroflexota bacterium]
MPTRDPSLYFRAFADRKRLHIAQCLAGRDQMTVTEIGAELSLSQPLMSWHLRMLRRAGIVKTRRAGRQVFCSLNKKSLEGYQRQINEMFELDMRISADEDQPTKTLTSVHK